MTDAFPIPTAVPAIVLVAGVYWNISGCQNTLLQYLTVRRHHFVLNVGHKHAATGWS